MVHAPCLFFWREVQGVEDYLDYYTFPFSYALWEESLRKLRMRVILIPLYHSKVEAPR